jgi:hypothetical protein
MSKRRPLAEGSCAPKMLDPMWEVRMNTTRMAADRSQSELQLGRSAAKGGATVPVTVTVLPSRPAARLGGAGPVVGAPNLNPRRTVTVPQAATAHSLSEIEGDSESL